MSNYDSLASWYDSLTGDVPYPEFTDYYEKAFAENGGEFHTILDLCCGTGTICSMMSGKGYEMIAVDSSEEMLMEAREKSPETLFLCQDARELDLYGTVDACYSSLDSINYIPREDFETVLRRLHLFIRPGGLFIFDIRPENWMEAMDGAVSVDETDDMLCLWRADYHDRVLSYGMDIFELEGSAWNRYFEEHIEYAYSSGEIRTALENTGFSVVREDSSDNRRYFVAERNA